MCAQTVTLPAPQEQQAAWIGNLSILENLIQWGADIKFINPRPKDHS
jgi:hypothetical protein